MIFTDEQKRMIRDYSPTLGDRPWGIDLAQILEDAFATRDAALAAIRSGTAVVLNTAATVVVAVGAAYDGKPATATLKEADGTLAVQSAVWDGSGNLTITLTGSATGDRDVSWIVDGR